MYKRKLDDLEISIQDDTIVITQPMFHYGNGFIHLEPRQIDYLIGELQDARAEILGEKAEELIIR